MGIPPKMAETCRLRIYIVYYKLPRRMERSWCLWVASIHFPHHWKNSIFMNYALSIQVFMCNEGFCVFYFFSCGKEGFGVLHSGLRPNKRLYVRYVWWEQLRLFFMDCFLKNQRLHIWSNYVVSLIFNPRDPITLSEDDWSVQSDHL